jgi:hypothetical protein
VAHDRCGGLTWFHCARLHNITGRGSRACVKNRAEKMCQAMGAV